MYWYDWAIYSFVFCVWRSSGDQRATSLLTISPISEWTTSAPAMPVVSPAVSYEGATSTGEGQCVEWIWDGT